tara:strand:- start:6094 stop:7065 length:972 start_codon:yes stop_codon:yes gene_type:complete
MEQDLTKLTREELQNLAKISGIRADQKSVEIISQLKNESQPVLKASKESGTKKQLSGKSKSETTKSKKSPPSGEKSKTKKSPPSGEKSKTKKYSPPLKKYSPKTLKVKKYKYFSDKLPENVKDLIHKSNIYSKIVEELNLSNNLDYSHVDLKKLSKSIGLNLTTQIDEFKEKKNSELSFLIKQKINKFENDKTSKIYKLHHCLQGIWSIIYDECDTPGYGMDNESVLNCLDNMDENNFLERLINSMVSRDFGTEKISLNEHIDIINHEIKEMWNTYRIKVRDDWLRDDELSEYESIYNLTELLNKLLENAHGFIPIKHIINKF